MIVIVVVTGGKQSQLLASALGLGWSLTKCMKGVKPEMELYTICATFSLFVLSQLKSQNVKSPCSHNLISTYLSTIFCQA